MVTSSDKKKYQFLNDGWGSKKIYTMPTINPFHDLPINSAANQSPTGLDSNMVALSACVSFSLNIGALGIEN